MRKVTIVILSDEVPVDAFAPPSAGPPTARPVWVAIFLLTAALVAAVAGFLSWAGGVEPPHALLAAGGAFGATILLLVALAQYLNDGGP